MNEFSGNQGSPEEKEREQEQEQEQEQERTQDLINQEFDGLQISILEQAEAISEAGFPELVDKFMRTHIDDSGKRIREPVGPGHPDYSPDAEPEVISDEETLAMITAGIEAIQIYPAYLEQPPVDPEQPMPDSRRPEPRWDRPDF